MKHLYQINKVLIIINLILGLTIYLGLLFLIVLGIAQIIMSVIIAYNEKQLTKEVSTLYNIYALTTVSILVIFLLMYCAFIPSSSILIFSMIAISIIIAFLHLRITYLIKTKTL